MSVGTLEKPAHRLLSLGVPDAMMTSLPQKTMKLFQFDKKIWDNGEVSRTLQFGIIKNRALLWVNYENPTNQYYSSGGFHITLLFLQSDSLFGAELNNNKQCFSFYFFTHYFEGY